MAKSKSTKKSSRPPRPSRLGLSTLWERHWEIIIAAIAALIVAVILLMVR